MTHSLTRTNVTLPSSLLAKVDRIAGARGRSRYVAEAVAQRVRRDELGAAITETAGVMVGRLAWLARSTTSRPIPPPRALPARRASNAARRVEDWPWLMR